MRRFSLLEHLSELVNSNYGTCLYRVCVIADACHLFGSMFTV
jgi:hypothetical protein